MIQNKWSDAKGQTATKSERQRNEQMNHNTVPDTLFCASSLYFPTLDGQVEKGGEGGLGNMMP